MAADQRESEALNEAQIIKVIERMEEKIKRIAAKLIAISTPEYQLTFKQVEDILYKELEPVLMEAVDFYNRTKELFLNPNPLFNGLEAIYGSLKDAVQLVNGEQPDFISDENKQALYSQGTHLQSSDCKPQLAVQGIFFEVGSLQQYPAFLQGASLLEKGKTLIKSQTDWLKNFIENPGEVKPTLQELEKILVIFQKNAVEMVQLYEQMLSQVSDDDPISDRADALHKLFIQLDAAYTGFSNIVHEIKLRDSQKNLITAEDKKKIANLKKGLGKLRHFLSSKSSSALAFKNLPREHVGLFELVRREEAMDVKDSDEAKAEDDIAIFASHLRGLRVIRIDKNERARALTLQEKREQQEISATLKNVGISLSFVEPSMMDRVENDIKNIIHDLEPTPAGVQTAVEKLEMIASRMVGLYDQILFQEEKDFDAEAIQLYRLFDFLEAAYKLRDSVLMIEGDSIVLPEDIDAVVKEIETLSHQFATQDREGRQSLVTRADLEGLPHAKKLAPLFDIGRQIGLKQIATAKAADEGAGDEKDSEEEADPESKIYPAGEFEFDDLNSMKGKIDDFVNQLANMKPEQLSAALIEDQINESLKPIADKMVELHHKLSRKTHKSESDFFLKTTLYELFNHLQTVYKDLHKLDYTHHKKLQQRLLNLKERLDNLSITSDPKKITAKDFENLPRTHSVLFQWCMQARLENIQAVCACFTPPGQVSLSLLKNIISNPHFEDDTKLLKNRKLLRISGNNVYIGHNVSYEKTKERLHFLTAVLLNAWKRLQVLEDSGDPNEADLTQLNSFMKPNIKTLLHQLLNSHEETQKCLRSLADNLLETWKKLLENPSKAKLRKLNNFIKPNIEVLLHQLSNSDEENQKWLQIWLTALLSEWEELLLKGPSDADLTELNSFIRPAREMLLSKLKLSDSVEDETQKAL